MHDESGHGEGIHLGEDDRDDDNGVPEMLADLYIAA